LSEMVPEIQCTILRQDKFDNHWFRLSLAAPPRFFREFTPGMFIMVKTADYGNDPFLRRPFSVAYLSKKKNLFDIIYRITGRGTTLLSLKAKGEKLNIIGPLGKGFEIPGNLKSLYLVAGGIGIAPLISLYQAITTASKNAKQRFLWGITSKKVLIDFNEIYPDLAPFDLSIASEDGSIGSRGNVVNLLSGFLWEKTMEDFAVFACGPIKMLSALQRLCKKQKIPLFVSIESKMACGQGYCMGCAIPSTEASYGNTGKHKYLKVCQDGPVFKADRINWSKIEDAVS